MKTTVEMDKKLLEEAREILGTRTIKETVEESLRRVVRQRQLQKLVDAAGTFDIDLTVEKLREMRHKRTRNYAAR